jgi:hypothetical protein
MRLVLDPQPPQPGIWLRPANEPLLLMTSLFGSLQPAEGQLEIVSTYRHQNFLPEPIAGAVAGKVLRAVDAFGRAVAGAQVFAVERNGPRLMSPNRLVTLQLQRLDAPVGLAPVAQRIVGEAIGWEARDVPPGMYRISIGDADYEITVPAGGFVQLQ